MATETETGDLTIAVPLSAEEVRTAFKFTDIESNSTNLNVPPVMFTNLEDKVGYHASEEPKEVDSDGHNIPFARNHIVHNSGSNDGNTGDVKNGDAQTRVKRKHRDWKKTPKAKQQAIEMVVNLKGALRPALRKLQNDDELNESGIFNDLSAGTLGDWYRDFVYTQKHGKKDRKFPKHMTSVVSSEVLDAMFVALDKLYEEDIFLNCAKVRPVFREILVSRQPEILPPPDGQGTFSLSRGWINNVRKKWKKTKNLQEGLPKEHSLSPSSLSSSSPANFTHFNIVGADVSQSQPPLSKPPPPPPTTV